VQAVKSRFPQLSRWIASLRQMKVIHISPAFHLLLSPKR